MYTWILQASTPAYISITYCHGTSQLHTTRCMVDVFYTASGLRPSVVLITHQPTPRYVTYTYTSQPLFSEDEAEFLTLIPNLSKSSIIAGLRFKVLLYVKAHLCLSSMMQSLLCLEKLLIFCYISTILWYVKEYVGVVFCYRFNAFLVRSHGRFNVLNMDTIRDHIALSLYDHLLHHLEIYMH